VNVSGQRAIPARHNPFAGRCARPVRGCANTKEEKKKTKVKKPKNYDIAKNNKKTDEQK
jgi:hypothetical protein